MPQNTPLFEPAFPGLGVVRSDDVTRDARYGKKQNLFGMLTGRLIVRSYLAVPVLSSSGPVNGGLFFGHSKAGVFGAQVEKIIVGIAAHAAVAIHNAQLFEQLHRNDERLRDALAAADMGTWRVNLHTGLDERDARLNQILGLERLSSTQPLEDTFGRIHPEDQERVKALWGEASSGNGFYECVHRIIRPNGEVRWVRNRGRFVRSPEGDRQYATGTVLDITESYLVKLERDQAEEALRESEERFGRFMQQLPGLAWIKDVRGHYVYANGAAEKAFRTPRERLYGRTDNEIFPAEVATQFNENDRRALASETGIQVVETLEHEDGVLHHSIVSKFPILGPDGQPALIGGMAIDITEQQQAEEALRESEERFRRLVSVMPSAMFTCDAEGLITYYNRSAAELWGREPKLRDPEDRYCGSLLLFRSDGTPMPHDQCPMAEAVLHGIPARNIEILIQRPEGTMISASVNIDPLYNEAGVRTGAINVFQDITRRKQVEAERERLLAELDKERAQLKELAETLEERVLRRTAQVRDLASALALAEERERFRISQVLHDNLQQLIYSQLMRLELLQKKLAGEPKEVLDDLVAGMKEQMTQAIQVTRALAAELTPPEEAAESLGKGLEWLALHMQEAHGLNVTLKFNHLYGTHCGELQGLLLQIVRELLFNVVKHAGTHQAVLELKRQDGFLEISVQDEGTGFEVQSIHTRSERQVGFGLLSISDRLRLLGGRLEIESAPGEGTRMTICAPVEA